MVESEVHPGYVVLLSIKLEPVDTLRNSDWWWKIVKWQRSTLLICPCPIAVDVRKRLLEVRGGDSIEELLSTVIEFATRIPSRDLPVLPVTAS
jgi:hypothetical protein